MHPTLLITHSVIRYFLLIFILVVLYRSLTGWQSKKAYVALDDKLSLWLMILTHTQFVLGLILYFVSPIVIFSSASMKDAITRYWLVEHITLMIVSVGLITAARSTAKRMTDPVAKHKRMFILNAIAVVIIVIAIASMKDRGFFAVTM